MSQLTLKLFNMQTLAEFIKEVRGNDEYVPDGLWKKHTDTLLTFPEFRNVKKINIVDMPIFRTVNGAPLTEKTEYLGGGTGVACVEERKMGDDIFTEEIDIFDVHLSPVLYNCNGPEINANECGVWASPTLYNPINFSPRKKIEIVYSLADIQENLIELVEMTLQTREKKAKEIAKKIILDKVAHYIDTGETNWPELRSVLIRCSSRSFKNKKQENDEN